MCNFTVGFASLKSYTNVADLLLIKLLFEQTLSWKG